jgi:glucose/arabinose dehydrogenase
MSARPPHRHRRPFRARLVFDAACWLTLAVALRAHAAAGIVPTNFTDSAVVGGLRFPVGMTPLPDGRVLFTEQFTARIRLIVNGALSATDPVCTVPDVRNNPGSEQGLLGIAVDPGWPARPYVYVHYDAASSATIHLARFTVGGDVSFTGNGALTIDTATRRDILVTIPDNASNHNGGTLRFGPDGMLYDSIGEDAVQCAAQDTTALQGKILRLDISTVPAGAGGPPALSVITPANNPFVLGPNANERLVWALGLRNPFRFNVDTDGALYVADVGDATWEEIDRLPGGGLDLGWPLFEGHATHPTSCPGVSGTGMTGPIYDFQHVSGSYAVIGGPVYRAPSCAPAGTNFPTAYIGDYFFSEYYHGFLRRLKGSGTTWALATPEPGQPNSTDWGTGFDGVSDWMLGCDAALWYCRQSVAFSDNTGEIRRIVYTGTTGVPSTSNAVEFRAPRPSPARGAVTLSYSLARAAVVSLEILGARGERVRRLVVSATQAAGDQVWTWDGLDEHGNAAPAGLYLARLRVDGQDLVRRIPMIR